MEGERGEIEGSRDWGSESAEERRRGEEGIQHFATEEGRLDLIHDVVNR